LAAVEPAMRAVETDLNRGNAVVVHCRQGVGRSSVIAALLLGREGFHLSTALEHIKNARGVRVPETAEQRRWLERYMPALVPQQRK